MARLWYVIEGRDGADGAARRVALRPAHLARARALQDEGRLLAAGPFPRVDAATLEAGVSGSLLIAAFDSLQAAEQWWAADPYVQGGVFSETSVRPWLTVLPA
ncbi:MAG TPA: YciI family protein [Nevskiaceae bacterium]|nr:YciI family protein [Nevskiaceae bacterium]